MSRAPRVVLLTSDQRRHRFAACRLDESLRLAGIVSEAKPSSPAVAPQGLPPEDDDVVRRHFEQRDEVEHRLLGEPGWPAVERIAIAAGEINSEAVCRWIREREPDLLVLYGTRIVTDPLLAAYPDRMVNLHLGLSPYYRGSGTNFWPLARREPECVGATLHLAVRRVDAGPILAQMRPDAEASDRCHELGTKALMRGLEALPVVLGHYLEGRIRPVPQDPTRGQVFRNRDFHAGAVREMWAHLDAGMIAEYLADAAGRQARFPLVETLVP